MGSAFSSPPLPLASTSHTAQTLTLWDQKEIRIPRNLGKQIDPSLFLLPSLLSQVL